MDEKGPDGSDNLPWGFLVSVMGMGFVAHRKPLGLNGDHSLPSECGTTTAFFMLLLYALSWRGGCPRKIPFALSPS
jgi:hypothetical protein